MLHEMRRLSLFLLLLEIGTKIFLAEFSVVLQRLHFVFQAKQCYFPKFLLQEQLACIVLPNQFFLYLMFPEQPYFLPIPVVFPIKCGLFPATCPAILYDQDQAERVAL